MYNKKYTLLIFLVTMLIIMPFVSSAPPFATTPVVSQNSMQIESPNLPIHEAGIDKRFHAHVINATAKKTNLTTSCALHVYNSTGWDISTGSQWMEWEDYNQIDFAMTVKGGNFTQTGIYAYVIQCNSSNEIAFYRGQFQVSPNGEVADEGTAIFYIGLLAILVVFLIVAVYFMTDSENLLVRVGAFGGAYLMLIAITFISWNMAQDFLTSSPFLIEMLRIIFLVLVIGAFPLLIGAFAWYVIMLFKIKEIDRLMTKGISYDEAERRTGRKFR